MSEKKKAAAEITALAEAFCKQHLDAELSACTHKLCETLGRKRLLDISRGKKEIWAAATVYVIARLNFLFDKSNPFFLTVETICEFFGTKKTTISNKAALIEKTCNIGIGEPDYCTREISEALSFVQLPNGLILPEGMVSTIAFEAANEEESREIDRFFAEQLQKEEAARKARSERRAEINRETAEKKRAKKEEKERGRQPSLFGD